jgi:hypothetical protein
MRLNVTYRVGWLPFRETQTWWLEMKRDSKGLAHWEQGRPLAEADK